MCFAGLYYTSRRQGTSEDRTVNFISEQVSMPGLLPGQDLPSRNSLMLGQVLSMVIIVGSWCGSCSTMATKILRSKWEIESPSLFWRKSTHRQWRRCKVLTNTVRGSGGFGSTGVKSGNDTGRISEKKNENGKNERTEVRKRKVRIKMRL